MTEQKNMIFKPSSWRTRSLQRTSRDGREEDSKRTESGIRLQRASNDGAEEHDFQAQQLEDQQGRNRRRLQITEQRKTPEDQQGRNRKRLQRTEQKKRSEDGAEEDSRGLSRARLQRMDQKKTPEDRADSSHKSLPGWLVQCCEWFSILCLNPFPDISKLH